MGNLDANSILQLSIGSDILRDTSKHQPKPFVKWPGGKSSLSGSIISKFPQSINNYFEPFVGGGAIFFKMTARNLEFSQKNQYVLAKNKSTNYFKKAFLTDINENLIESYNVIKTDVKAVIQKLRRHSNLHSEKYYYEMRNLHNLNSPVERVARFIYLNKTCFNGLYRVNKDGRFNVPMGSYKKPNICDEHNLLVVSKALSNVVIASKSFESIKPSKGDFVYCDPPYHDCFTSYTSDNFGEDKQKLLANMVARWSEQGIKVMISNSDTKFIRKLYSRFNFQGVTTRRYINCNGNGRVKEQELLITNY